MSSAYQIRLTGSVGRGISSRYKLNYVGDILEPCSTPVWTIIAFDLTPLQILTDYLPLMLFYSHRQVASGSVDLTIFDNNTLWLTVSNATVRSTATQTVRCGGFLWLKPVAISLVSCSKAEVVECPGRKSCWSADGRRWLLMVGVRESP